MQIHFVSFIKIVIVVSAGVGQGEIKRNTQNAADSRRILVILFRFWQQVSPHANPPAKLVIGATQERRSYKYKYNTRLYIITIRQILRFLKTNTYLISILAK